MDKYNFPFAVIKNGVQQDLVKKNIATTSNDFVNARYSLGIVETRLFLFVLNQISPSDDFSKKEYIVFIKDFIESCKLETKAYGGKKEVSLMMQITKNLMSKVISIPQENGVPRLVNLTAEAIYHKDEKGEYVSIALSDRIKKDLIGLKEKFLSFDLCYVLPCKSVYSIRLYQLLKQYFSYGFRIETVANLKYMFSIENKYRNYTEFKKKVIIKAQTELKEKTDIRFEFTDIKTGRTVTGIKFVIYKNKPQAKTTETQKTSISGKSTTGASRPEQERPATSPLIKRLISLGFNDHQAKEIIKQQTPEFITTNADILEELQRQGRIKTNIPAFSKGFTKDFRQTKSAHEIEQELKAEQTKQDAERISKAKAEQAKAEQLGRKIYSESLKTYVDKFFNNRELNADLIKEFETRYIKTGVGATLFKNRPETAKTAFIQTNKQIDINTEVIKIAESDGYLLTFDGEQWQAIEDNQEKLF